MTFKWTESLQKKIMTPRCWPWHVSSSWDITLMSVLVYRAAIYTLSCKNGRTVNFPAQCNIEILIPLETDIFIVWKYRSSLCQFFCSYNLTVK